MDSHFKALIITHRTAPVEIRERIALDESGCKNLMMSLREVTDASEYLILSTCNRTEVYYTSEKDYSTEIIQLLGLQRGFPNVSEIKEYFQSLSIQEDAIEHLFGVSTGLDSQVIGDMQIPNQVKHAYQWSADLGFAGPFLHRLMHTIFFTNKKVAQETSFRDGAASVSYATVELAEELLADKIDPKVLIIGLGEMGADICRNFVNTSVKDITITNRTLSKAQELADECKEVKVLPFEQVNAAIAEADLIISSVALDSPLITKSLVSTFNIFSYKFFIDVSVPRSVEPSVEEVPGAIVYNIDHIKGRSEEALELRLKAIPHVKALIQESIAEFNDWTREMIVSPTINKLKNALEQIRQEEMSRYMKQMNEDEARKVDTITRNMMQKIIKLPVLQLKAACKRGEADSLIDVLNDLFNLEKQPETFTDHK